MKKRDEGQPIVSVIMPAYNSEKYIKEAMESVLAQSMKELELLVIDDHSTDRTFEIAQTLAERDARVHIIRNEHNLGVAQSRNKGMAAANGLYIALLDSDDIWYDTKLEKQMALIKESNADIVYTSYRMRSDVAAVTYGDFIVPQKINYEELLIRNVFGCSTVLFAGKIAETYRFDESFYHEDYVLWLQLLRDGYRAAGVTEPLAEYRVVENSRSADKKNSAMKRWKIYRRYLHLPLCKSIGCFVRYGIAGIKKYKKV